MPIINGSKVMQAVLYTGTGATQTIAVGFQPDLVWIKSRSAATDNKLTDSVRGATKALISNSTGAETTDTNGITAFTSNGFTLGSDSVYNTNGATYVAWCWQAGQGSSSSNTSGTITSTVSVNASAGFSIVTYAGTGATATVGHGLGVAPSFMISKSRSGAGAWVIALTYSVFTYSSDYFQFDTGAKRTDGASTVWVTAPTSSVFSIGSSFGNGVTFVNYCWTPIAGYSAFGSYTGNGSTDGPFVYTGFRPKFVMMKRTDGVSDWWIFDTARDTYNVMTQGIYPNSSSAEVNNGATVDYLSNGFKLRLATYQPNTSGATFIYMAFAENPFKNSLAR
jgi:hypothetical protein